MRQQIAEKTKPGPASGYSRAAAAALRVLSEQYAAATGGVYRIKARPAAPATASGE